MCLISAQVNTRNKIVVDWYVVSSVDLLLAYWKNVSHDYNDELQGQTLAQFDQGWETKPIMSLWAKYAKKAYGMP